MPVRPWKLVVGTVVSAVLAAACAPASNPPNLPISQQRGLLVNVVDSLYDAGRAPSVALDKDGNPWVTYLLYKPVLKPGEIPPGVKVGDPQPPAVILASESGGIWQRVSVTPQETAPKATGVAPELVAKADDPIAGPRVSTGLAIDPQGHHHVVWSTPKGLYYSTDAAGSFSKPEAVTRSPSFGAAVAVGADGSPWVSYYAGGALEVAHRTGTRWVVGRVTAVSGPIDAPARLTAIALGGGGPVVAFGDAGATRVARRTAGAWSVESVPGPGGLGVSLVLDRDGNLHVAAYGPEGQVRYARSSGGGAWQTQDLATSPGQPTDDWRTAMAVDDRGTVFVAWADTSPPQIVLASSQGGPFRSQPVPGSQGGASPALAVSPDGRSLALAWFDTVNANLNVAQTSTGGLTLAHPLPTLGPPTASPQPTATGPGLPCRPSGTTLTITAPPGASASGFDKKCLAAPAGQPFTIQFQNQETGVPHNVEIFPNQQAAQSFSGRLGGAEGPSDTVTGPGTVTYKVQPLKAGIYYFQCDIHPTTMTGTFVVVGS